MAVLRKLLRLTGPEAGLLARAIAALAVARLLVVAVPFRRIAQLLGELQAESPEGTPAGREPWLRSLAWALSAAGRRLPWRCLCLEQAVACGLILRRSGLPYTLYLGTTRSGEGLEAHAWLRVGGVIVTGAAGRRRFTVVAKVAGPPLRPARG